MKLVFASNNKNKIQEIQALVPNTIQIVSLEDIGCTEDIPETADTIEGNAILKANYVTSNYGYDCFADDTGLEVEVLNGVPGVYSARYAGENSNDSDNNKKLIQNLKGIGNRKAKFVSVISIAKPNGEVYSFRGEVEGIILDEARGNAGFGYDPYFYYVAYGKTLAELELSEKNAISHRARALSKMKKEIKDILKTEN